MMPLCRTKILNDGELCDSDFKAISERDETRCSDDIWNYYIAHKDEAIDLEEYARKRGIKS
jgi:hypothetical protein